MLRKFVSQFGWGRLRPSDRAALAGASRHQWRGAGSVEEAPRYATLWLQAREIQMVLCPRGGKRHEGSEMRWPRLSLLLNASFSWVSSYFQRFPSPLCLHPMKC